MLCIFSFSHLSTCFPRSFTVQQYRPIGKPNWGLSRTIDILAKFSSLSLVLHLAAPDRTVVGSRPRDEESTDWASGVMERGESWGEGGGSERKRERENERRFKPYPPSIRLGESEITGKKRLMSSLPWSGPSGDIVNAELCASQSLCYRGIHQTLWSHSRVWCKQTQGIRAVKIKEGAFFSCLSNNLSNTSFSLWRFFLPGKEERENWIPSKRFHEQWSPLYRISQHSRLFTVLHLLDTHQISEMQEQGEMLRVYKASLVKVHQSMTSAGAPLIGWKKNSSTLYPLWILIGHHRWRWLNTHKLNIWGGWKRY